MALNQESGGSSDTKAIEFGFIQYLLKAPSKDVVKEFLQNTFSHLNQKAPESFIVNTAKALSIEYNDAKKLISSTSVLLEKTLFEGSTDPKEIFLLFPDDFHKSLRELLSILIAEQMPSWKLDSLSRQVSLPRLIDFDWRVDVKSNSVGRGTTPSCFLQFKVESDPLSGQVTRGQAKNVTVELTKETLETMLDGLGKIRDQLSSVAAR